MRHGDGCPQPSARQDEEDERETEEQNQVKEDEVRMIEDQNRHPDEAADDHMDQIHKEDRQGTLHERRFHEVIRHLGPESLQSKMRKLLSHGERCPDKQPTLQYLDRIMLQRFEQPHKCQHDDHNDRQRGNHDWLDRKRERIDQFLDGQGNDEREKSDHERIRDHQNQNSALRLEEAPNMP